ncbi:MAG: hypothetical protein K2M87_06285 [Muribaculaceae bacterium]|nr:hypothetical protein [Muribaculaceae bacterium]
MKYRITAALAAFICSIFGAIPVAAQTAAELLSKGHEAYMNYDFAEASKLYAQAKRKIKKGDSETSEQLSARERELTQARNFLERVEKIQIIDSITVPREAFFKAYRLPQSAGSLKGADALPPGAPQNSDYVFTNEGGDYKLWAAPDTTGYMHLVESTLLTDGTWSPATPLDEDLSEDADAIYPFMMSDGVTLYYAENGANSIGGYDIMVATRDATDGSFLQPSNLGFPYNSPYDDYLLAIDELNGVGWWATDRNNLGDLITIYVFIPNELRQNYNEDDGDLTDLARISDYIATQPEDADYDELLATIRQINPNAKVKKEQFRFPAPGGVIYTRYDELPSAQAQRAMQEYQKALSDYNNAANELEEMRLEFVKRRTRVVESTIMRLEKTQEDARGRLKTLRNAVYSALN